MPSFSILTFGDVFRYKEKDYIYLASTEEVIFTAQIFSPQVTYEIEKMAEKHDNRPHSGSSRSELYYFVILSTEEVRKRMASLAKTTDNDVSIYAGSYCKLNREDLKTLRDKILDMETPVPGVLKDLVKSISI